MHTKRVARFLLFAGLLGLALLALVAAVFTVALSRHFVPPILTHASADIEELWPSVEQDREALATCGLFTTPVTGADADPLLRRYIPSEQSLGNRRSSGGAPDFLPTQAHDAITAWGDDWLTADPSALAEIDVGWMHEALAYGRWDVYRRAVALAGQEDLPQLPLPETTQLQDWAKLRLRAGARSGHDAEACAEIRHLARLAYSTSTLVGALTATVLQRYTKHCAENGATGDPCAGVGSRTAQRYLMARARAPWLLLDRAQLQRVLPKSPSEPGACPAMGDLTANALLFRDSYTGRYAEGAALLTEALRTFAAPCGLEALAEAWGRRGPWQPGPTAVFLIAEGHVPWWAPVVMHTPLVGPALGQVLCVISMPNAFGGYKKVARGK